MAPAITIGARGASSHLFIAGPATASGVSPQLIILVSDGFIPRQTPSPVAARVAVNEPEGTEGVKVANAGLADCVHVPSPEPPVQLKTL